MGQPLQRPGQFRRRGQIAGRDGRRPDGRRNRLQLGSRRENRPRHDRLQRNQRHDALGQALLRHTWILRRQSRQRWASARTAARSSSPVVATATPRRLTTPRSPTRLPPERSLWVSRFDGSTLSFDAASALAVAPDGGASYVTGYSQTSLTSADLPPSPTRAEMFGARSRHQQPSSATIT